ncbi:DUF3127 domain-containing protein [Xanthocytophaga flava]|uniref:DUF3127 domain-containing protein n=1 Tax=Xanthocytophaga flava TaxID=3048013 RepID=UPI0028D0DD02|nr:DUF3127 domain-containing protein [Xanthocytophaga flavus]MDJ1468187.1 DUF3127 domain-containing protein [Xanthocytophaga flavus]
MISNTLSVTGKFLGAKPVRYVGDNNLAVREFYVDLTENAQYPNTPEFQLSGNQVTHVDKIQKGDLIEVFFRLDGRKFVSRETQKEGVATNLRAYKIDVYKRQSIVQQSEPQQQQGNQHVNETQQVAEVTNYSNGSSTPPLPSNPDDDLPF